MKRVLWVAGLAGLPACIEEHAPIREGEVDAGGRVEGDVAVDDAAPPDGPKEPDPAEPEAEVDGAIPVFDQGVVDAGPPPPAECRPGGHAGLAVGACIRGQDGAPEGSIAFVLDVLGEATSWDPDDRCRDGAVLGQLAGRPFILAGQDSSGQRWQVGVHLPTGLAFTGAPTTVEFDLGGFDPSGPRAGRLVVRSDDGHQPLVILTGHARFVGFEGGGLRLERGAQICFADDGTEDGCTYTGYDLRATAAGESREIGLGEIAPVGPFAVIHDGLVAIGDRGACNTGPEVFTLAAVEGLRAR